MDRDIVSQSMKTTGFSVALIFSFLSLTMVYSIAWGFFFGAFFSILNFYLLSLFFKKIFTPSSAEIHPLPAWRKATLVVAFLKIPALCGLIWLLLSQLHLSTFSFMIGFSFPFLVLLLKMIGQAIGDADLKIYGI